jgi:hypothetical protein
MLRFGSCGACAAALGKLLAVGIVLAPRATLLFPEPNHRSGNASRGGPAASAPALGPASIPGPIGRRRR